MQNFKEYVESHGYEKVPKGNIPGAWFQKNGLPMVVACYHCGMTMASPTAMIDEQGFAFCPTCAEVEED